MPISFTGKPGQKAPRETKTEPVQIVETPVEKAVETPPSPPVSKKMVKVKSDSPNTEPKKISEALALIKQFHKDYGDKSVVKGSEIPDVKRLATGIFEFDFATGGGFPKGKYSIIYGPESSGKSNACYCAAAVAQRGPEECNKVVWVDLEHSFDPEWAVQFGVDIDALIVVKPAYGEQAVDMVEGLIQADDVALVVVDSLAVMVAAKELDQSVEKYDVGTSALLIKRMVNKVIFALSKESSRGHEPAVVFINQTRTEIGKLFGDPEKMPGGKALLFLSSLTVRVRGANKVVKEINPDIPTFKETFASIKKAKVGVIKSEFKYDLVMRAYDDLSVGETDSWNLVKNELQAAGLLTSAGAGKGWDLEGSNYKTQAMIADTYAAEPEYRLHLQDLVIKQYASKKALIGGNVSENPDNEQLSEAQPE